MNNHSKSSEQDALIPKDCLLSKMSSSFHKNLLDIKKLERELNNNLAQDKDKNDKILEQIKELKQKNRDILKTIEKMNKENDHLAEEGEKFKDEEEEKIKKMISDVWKNKNKKEKEIYIETLENELEFIEIQAKQISQKQEIYIDNSKVDVFYLKKSEENGADVDEYPVKLDEQSGEPVLFCEIGDGYYRILYNEGEGIWKKGDEISIDDGYEKKNREVFSTIQYDRNGILELAEEGIDGKIPNDISPDKVNISECKKIKNTTADYDQLFAAITKYSFSFVKGLKDKDNSYGNDESIEKICDTEGISDMREYLYNYNYFQITLPHNSRIRKKIEECDKVDKRLRYLGSCILNNDIRITLKSIVDFYNSGEYKKFNKKIGEIIKSIAIECKEDKLINAKLKELTDLISLEIDKNNVKKARFKSIGTPNVITEEAVKLTNSFINHGPETLHYYPEGFKDKEVIVTLAPSAVVSEIKEDNYVKNINCIIGSTEEDNKETAELKNKVKTLTKDYNNNILILEGLDGVVELANQCNIQGLSFIEVNPLWPIDVDLLKEPTELLTNDNIKPSIEKSEYETLSLLDGGNIVNKFIYAERLRLQSDNIVIPSSDEFKNITEEDLKNIRKYAKKKNLEIVLEQYNSLLNDDLSHNYNECCVLNGKEVKYAVENMRNYVQRRKAEVELVLLSMEMDSVKVLDVYKNLKEEKFEEVILLINDIKKTLSNTPDNKTFGILNNIENYANKHKLEVLIKNSNSPEESVNTLNSLIPKLDNSNQASIMKFFVEKDEFSDNKYDESFTSCFNNINYNNIKDRLDIYDKVALLERVKKTKKCNNGNIEQLNDDILESLKAYTNSVKSPDQLVGGIKFLSDNYTIIFGENDRENKKKCGEILFNMCDNAISFEKNKGNVNDLIEGLVKNLSFVEKEFLKDKTFNTENTKKYNNAKTIRFLFSTLNKESPTKEQGTKKGLKRSTSMVLSTPY